MEPVRGVFFDLDATLLDYGRAVWEANVREVCATLAPDVPGLRAEWLFAAYTRAYQAHLRAAEGKIARSPSGSRYARMIWVELWRSALADCGCGRASVAGRALELYTLARRDAYRLFDDVVEVLIELRDHVDALAVVTNGPGDAQRDKLAATGLERHVDLVVISAEAGVAKPGRAIFDLTLRQLGMERRAAWHVGDSLATDVAGAHNAGLGGAVWLNRTGARPARDTASDVHEIASLRELPALLPAGRPGR